MVRNHHAPAVRPDSDAFSFGESEPETAWRINPFSWKLLIVSGLKVLFTASEQLQNSFRTASEQLQNSFRTASEYR